MIQTAIGFKRSIRLVLILPRHLVVDILQVNCAEDSILRYPIYRFIDPGKRVRIQCCKTVYCLGIINYKSLFMPFIFRDNNLRFSWRSAWFNYSFRKQSADFDDINVQSSWLYFLDGAAMGLHSGDKCSNN